MTEFEKRYSRRNALKLIGGLATASLIGCGSENENGVAEKKENVSIPQEVLALYPELDPNNATSFNSIKTGAKLVNIANFTGLEIDPSKIEAAYVYLEAIASQKKIGRYKRSDTGELVEFIVQPNQQRTQNIFVISEKDPNPSWGKFDQDAVTITPNDPTKPYLTRIRLSKPDTQNPFFNTQQKLLDAFMSVEACQATVLVGGRTVDNANLMQEVYCNSIGNSLAIKQQGKTYEQYLDFQNNSTMLTPIGKLNYLGFTQEEYSTLPTK